MERRSVSFNANRRDWEQLMVRPPLAKLCAKNAPVMNFCARTTAVSRTASSAMVNGIVVMGQMKPTALQGRCNVTPDRLAAQSRLSACPAVSSAAAASEVAKETTQPGQVCA